VPRKETSQNGQNRLEEAMAMLIQNQVAFLSRAAESDRHLAEIERRHIEIERVNSERFGRVEQDIANIVRILGEHGRMIERLTEAVREGIGFKGQECVFSVYMMRRCTRSPSASFRFGN
jgi:hypothetical protein